MPKQSDWLSNPDPGHLVQFYNTDNTLVPSLVEFIKTGISNEDTCIVVASSTHIQILDYELQKNGIDILASKASGHYITLNAAATLDKIMVKNVVDKNKFMDVITPLFEKKADGSRVRIFGEMVSLLWRAGNKQAVFQLENLWNELSKTYSFSLYCAYPELHFIMDRDVRRQIQDCHNVNLPSLIAG